MRKYDIDNFEFEINPSVWDAAQDLNAAGVVRAVHEVEKHFWVAMVYDPEGGEYEVELLLSPRKIKGYTCDCWGAPRKTPCRHIAAVAAKVRSYLQQQKEEKVARKASKKEEKSITRLTVAQLIKGISEQDLKEFVADFAKGNRDFALAFKTRFAGTVEMRDNPYEKLLGSLLPPKQKHHYPLKRSPYMRVRRSIQDLNEQAQQATDSSDVRKAVEITLPILRSVGYLANNSTETQTKELEKILLQTASIVQELSKSKLPPELQDELYGQLFEIFRSSEMPNAIWTPIAKVLAKRSRKDTELSEAIQMLFDKTPTPIPQHIILLFNTTQIEQGSAEAAIRILESLQIEPKHIETQAKALHQMGYRTESATILYYFLSNQTFKGWTERMVEDHLLDVGLTLKKASFLPELLTKRFVSTGNVQLLKDLKQRTGKRWPSLFQTLQTTLIENEAYPQLVLALAYEGHLQQLEAVLKAQPELDWLSLAMPILAEKHSDWLADTYLFLFQNHLDTHFGPPAARPVAEHLSALIRAEHLALAERISKSLLKSHKNRTGLREALMDIFPRRRHRAIFAVG